MSTKIRKFVGGTLGSEYISGKCIDLMPLLKNLIKTNYTVKSLLEKQIKTIIKMRTKGNKTENKQLIKLTK